ncbi:MAG: pseudouridine synthase [Bacillota bacterium]
MRLDKLLSTLHYGSRKEVKEDIKHGYIRVNDAIVSQPDYHIDPNHDKISYHNEIIYFNNSIIIMMHKPQGVVSANHDNVHQTVMDLLDEKYQRLDVHVAGRLDIDTEGLLLLTNDGNIIHKLIHAKKHIEKVYEVTTKNTISNIEDLRKPMTLLDGNNKPYQPKSPRIITHQNNTATIAITEGKFHQVKRMFNAIGHTVVYLKRTRIHTLKLDPNLSAGEYRVLTDSERAQLLDV